MFITKELIKSNLIWKRPSSQGWCLLWSLTINTDSSRVPGQRCPTEQQSQSHQEQRQTAMCKFSSAQRQALLLCSHLPLSQSSAALTVSKFHEQMMEVFYTRHRNSHLSTLTNTNTEARMHAHEARGSGVFSLYSHGFCHLLQSVSPELAPTQLPLLQRWSVLQPCLLLNTVAEHTS